jgi:hypothetical protein
MSTTIKNLNDLIDRANRQIITEFKWFIIFVFSLVIFAIMACRANAAGAYTVKSHRVNEDADYVYYSDTKSDGTEKTRKVRKPKPRQYAQSVTLVATNDLPVQVQYVYAELYADGHVKTNYQYRTKTARERVKIKVPPMPEVAATQKPRSKADALRLAKARRQQTATDGKKVTNKKTMYRPDRVVSSKVHGKTITHTWKSGKKTTEKLKRAYTARVKTAPGFELSTDTGNFSAIGPGGHKPYNKKR